MNMDVRYGVRCHYTKAARACVVSMIAGGVLGIAAQAWIWWLHLRPEVVLIVLSPVIGAVLAGAVCRWTELRVFASEGLQNVRRLFLSPRRDIDTGCFYDVRITCWYRLKVYFAYFIWLGNICIAMVRNIHPQEMEQHIRPVLHIPSLHRRSPSCIGEACDWISWFIPRRYREAFVGDLFDDMENMERLGYSLARILSRAAIQLMVAAIVGSWHRITLMCTAFWYYLRSSC